MATQGRESEASECIDGVETSSTFTQANLLSSQGKIEEAVEVYSKFLETNPGEDAAHAHQELALLLLRLGRLEEAADHCRTAIKLDEDFYGKNHPQVADDLCTYSTVLMSQDLPDEGLEAAQRSLEIRERVLGPDHPSLTYSMCCIGKALADKGNLTEAEKHYRRALVIDVKAHGQNHPQVIEDLLLLGAVLQSKGEYATAKGMFQGARDACVKVYGEDHPVTLNHKSQYNLRMLQWPKCASCQAELDGPKFCAACHNVQYCSRDCQKRHWKIHKPQCVPKDSTVGTAKKSDLVTQFLAERDPFAQVCATDPEPAADLMREALSHYHAINTRIDYNKGFELFLKALIEFRSPAAAVMLAHAHRFAFGVAKDDRVSRALALKAMQHGLLLKLAKNPKNTTSIYACSCAAWWGFGLEENNSKALSFAEQAGQEGLACAQVMAGTINKTMGHDTKAKEWFERGAEAGAAGACYMLAQVFNESIDWATKKPKYLKTYNLLKKAAEADFEDSKQLLRMVEDAWAQSDAIRRK
eukprot:c17780_g1_i1.p1 GENE.c17780_g1_i1~~c17780_g1_i1.p1  ORF type:complete len:527 (+),score=109.37 c17780_g1_i1:263-1843(+)